MDIFAKNKLLTRLVAALLVINIIVSGYIWLPKKENNAAINPERDFKVLKQALKEKLKLSEAQESELLILRQEFFSKEEKLKALIKSERDSMNQGMFNEYTDTLAIKNIARRVADNEYRMELYRLEQAVKLKALCTKTQLARFNELVKDIRDYFKPVKKN